MDKDSISEARAILRAAENVCVLSGAGISQESGVPTFRGDDGLWKNYRAEELATAEAFYNDPVLVWEWYESRRELMLSAEPNPGHHAIVRLEDEKPGFTLITQNIDGLHKMAGSRSVVEMHGNIWEVRCTLTGEVEENREVPFAKIPPVCKSTGEMARPNVVWFGEVIPPGVIQRCLDGIEACDVLLVVGTSGVVHPASALAGEAKRLGKKVIELNLEATPNSPLCDISLMGKSGEVLPLLVGSAPS